VFLEHDHVQLSAAQAAALTGLDDRLCLAMLNALADAQFLMHTADATFSRRRPDSARP